MPCYLGHVVGVSWFCCHATHARWWVFLGIVLVCVYASSLLLVTCLVPSSYTWRIYLVWVCLLPPLLSASPPGFSCLCICSWLQVAQGCHLLAVATLFPQRPLTHARPCKSTSGEPGRVSSAAAKGGAKPRLKDPRDEQRSARRGLGRATVQTLRPWV